MGGLKADLDRARLQKPTVAYSQIRRLRTSFATRIRAVMSAGAVAWSASSECSVRGSSQTRRSSPCRIAGIRWCGRPSNISFGSQVTTEQVWTAPAGVYVVDQIPATGIIRPPVRPKRPTILGRSASSSSSDHSRKESIRSTPVALALYDRFEGGHRHEVVSLEDPVVTSIHDSRDSTKEICGRG